MLSGDHRRPQPPGQAALDPGGDQLSVVGAADDGSRAVGAVGERLRRMPRRPGRMRASAIP